MPGLGPDVTNITSPMMMKMGATKKKNDVHISCAGVLIGPVWASCALSLMGSSKMAKRSRCGRSHQPRKHPWRKARDYSQRGLLGPIFYPWLIESND